MLGKVGAVGAKVRDASRKVVTGDKNKSIRQEGRKKWRKLVTGSSNTSVRAVLKKELNRPVRVKTRDKLSFTLGIINMLITQWVLLDHPTHFWKWYTLWVFPLLAYRYWDYKRAKMQYFLLDFCYYTNIALLFHIFVMPDNEMLNQIVFVCANGPLLWAIVAWRNSLVFHSLDKVTSVFIHVFPPLVSWAERWYGHHTASACPRLPPAHTVAAASPPATDGAPFIAMLSTWAHVSSDFLQGIRGAFNDSPSCSMSWTQLLWVPLASYLMWQASYLLQTEVVDGKKLRGDKTIETSMRWFIKARSGALYAAVRSTMRKLGFLKAGEHIDPESAGGKAAFVVTQLLFTVITMLPAKLCYENFGVHSVVLATVLTNCLWNGASYYVEVFSRKYQSRVDRALEEYTRLSKELEEMKARRSGTPRKEEEAGDEQSPLHMRASRGEAGDSVDSATPLSPDMSDGRSRASTEETAGSVEWAIDEGTDTE